MHRMETHSLDINLIEIDVASQIEDKILKFGEIVDVKINAYVHDTFRPLNSFGFSNGIILDKRSKITKTKQYKAEQLKIDNIPEDPLAMLIFELIYTVKSKEQEIQIAVGWFPYPIGTKIYDPFSIDSKLIIGMGRTYSNRYILPYDGSKGVDFRCCLNTDTFEPKFPQHTPIPTYESYNPTLVENNTSIISAEKSKE